MPNPNLDLLLQQIKQLSSSEQNLIIQSIIFYKDDKKLTEKERGFIDKSKEYINQLEDVNLKLDKVIKKFE